MISRKIRKDNMFVAIDGFTVDGHNYINEAIENGANCIVVEKDIEIKDEGITVIRVENTQLALAKFSSVFYGEPSKKLNLIGVTGTNGKTSITYLIKAIFDAQKEKTGIIGTMGTIIDEKKMDNINTTPDSLTIQKYLNAMVEVETKYCAMEVSSHALALDRVEYMDFQLAVFTNLTEDHLDYHQTMENYLKCKQQLFNLLKPNGIAIINSDDQYYKNFIFSHNQNITYGFKNSNYQITNYKFDQKSYFTVNDKDNYNMKILGKYNIYNVLIVIILLEQLNIEKEIIKKEVAYNGHSQQFNYRLDRPFAKTCGNVANRSGLNLSGHQKGL